MRNYISRNMGFIFRERSYYIRPTLVPINNDLQARNFSTSSLLLKKVGAPPAAAASLAKKGPALEKSKLPVETDPHKLVNFVCGLDISKENPQDVPIKDDSEYPEWLWEVRMGKAPPLDEMDKNTKQYWRRHFAALRIYHAGVKKLRRF